MRWRVALSGHNFDLEDLPRWTKGGSYQIVEDSGTYYLETSAFERYDDASDVRRAAQELVGVINGLGRLQRPDFEPVEVAHVAQITPEGRVHQHMYLTETVRIRAKVSVMRISRADGVEVEPPDVGRFADLLGVATLDPLVQRALGYINRPEVTWNDLYRAFEVVEGEVGELMHSQRWVSKRQLTRFTRTANSYSALGYEARHGRDRATPPRDPMEYREARDLVLKLLRNWMDYKLATDNAESKK